MEHWFSPTLGCWFIANKIGGDLIKIKRKPYHALTFDSESALLKRFPGSVKTELMG